MRQSTSLLLLLILLLSLPPFGLFLAGYSVPPDLTLFPIATEPGASSISWLVWGTLAVLIAATLTPPIWRFFTFSITTKQETVYPTSFPWWGWIAIGWMACAWIVAWNRFTWFQFVQPHTFPLLWFGYIITLNALTFHRSGHCLLLDRPRFLAQLFLLSAGFWWTFEYLNQFVKNWHYVNLPETSPLESFVLTSLSFSTVLPAVLSTYEWLSTIPRLTRPFEQWHSLPWMTYQKTGWIFLSVSVLGLGLIGIWPTLLFPLLWLSPFGVLLGTQLVRKETTCFHGLAQGDWRPVILSALAALVCGFWWELWNGYSLVHWAYTIPSVQALKVFEMPVVGYSGYLPFGMLCLTITEIGLGYRTNRPLRWVSRIMRDNAR